MNSSRRIRVLREEGVHLFHPVLGWMATYRVLVLDSLDSLLPPAMAAVAQCAFVPGPLPVPRIRSFLFFLSAPAAVHGALRRSILEKPATWANLALVEMPFAQHYSRAVVVHLFAFGTSLPAFPFGAGALAQRRMDRFALAAVIPTSAAFAKTPVPRARPTIPN